MELVGRVHWGISQGRRDANGRCTGAPHRSKGTDETLLGCLGAPCSAETRGGCESQGDAQVKFEERHGCYGWGLFPGRGKRR